MSTESPPHLSVSTSLAGSLLIAMPTLRDPNFSHLVTLMISHDEGGAFGIVLGPSTGTAVRDISESFGVTWQRTGAATHVRYGGPCERSRIFLVHGGPEPLPDAVTIAPGLHMGSSPGLLTALSERREVPVMVFGGYAGWAPGQLEGELQLQSWLPGDCTPELIFDTPPTATWEEALRAMSLSPEMIVSGGGARA